MPRPPARHRRRRRCRRRYRRRRRRTDEKTWRTESTGRSPGHSEMCTVGKTPSRHQTRLLRPPPLPRSTPSLPAYSRARHLVLAGRSCARGGSCARGRPRSKLDLPPPPVLERGDGCTRAGAATDGGYAGDACDSGSVQRSWAQLSARPSLASSEPANLARRALRGSRQHYDRRSTNSHSTSPSTYMTYVHVRATAAQKHQNRLLTNNSQQPAPSLGSQGKSGLHSRQGGATRVRQKKTSRRARPVPSSFKWR